MSIPEALHLLEVGALSHDSVTRRLAVVHAQIRRLVPAVDRVSCALYEPEQGLLKTFVHSTTSAQPLRAYQFKLAESVALSALVREHGERVIDDIQVELHGHGHAHTEWLLAQGYRSSYTLPLFDHDSLIGLLFFDAMTPAAFQPLVCESLRPYANLIAMLLSQELSTMRMLVGSIHIAREFANLRDIETGSHLMRMAAFAQLIALRLARSRGYDDEFIEHIYLFAPLHDIGKIGVPDQIMLKPGRLDADEWRQMTEHVGKGEQIIERMIETFSLTHLAGVQVLRQIVAGHHERLDGSGYPRGLRGAGLPDAARIIAVADIYDALRSERPYKAAWSHDEVAAELRRMAAGGVLDAEMVEALLADPAALETIRARYHDADGAAAC